MMDAVLWTQVQAVFQDALDLPEAQRAEYLARACAGRPDVHTEVASLLAAHERAGSFIEPVPDRLEPGRRRDRFRWLA